MHCVPASIDTLSWEGVLRFHWLSRYWSSECWPPHSYIVRNFSSLSLPTPVKRSPLKLPCEDNARLSLPLDAAQQHCLDGNRIVVDSTVLRTIFLLLAQSTPVCSNLSSRRRSYGQLTIGSAARLSLNIIDCHRLYSRVPERQHVPN